MRGIGISVSDKGYIDVTKNGLPGVLRKADDCDIEAPKHGVDLSCSWRFTADQRSQAEREFDRLRKRLNDCLPIALEKREPHQRSPEQLEALRSQFGSSFVEHATRTETLLDFDQSLDREEGGDIEVDISLKYDKDSGDLWINASFYGS